MPDPCLATDGWAFVKETGANAEPLWGTREKTVWAPGESLMIVGAPGVGKTTLSHRRPHALTTTAAVRVPSTAVMALRAEMQGGKPRPWVAISVSVT